MKYEKWIRNNLLINTKNGIIVKGKFNKNFLNVNKDIFEYIKSKVSFLPKNTKISEILWCYLNDVKSKPKCKICNKPVNFINFKKGYYTYCSTSCSNLDEKIKEKKRQIFLKNYGVDNPSKSKTIKEKKKQTFLKNYGVDNPSKLNNVILRIKKTKKERYGNENYVNVNKIKKTKKERYGNENYVNVNKIKKTKKERYGNENYVNIDKVKKTMQNRYGVLHNWSNGILRNNYYNTMENKYGNKIPLLNDSIKRKMIQTKRKNTYNNQIEIYKDSELKILTSEEEFSKFGIITFQCKKCNNIFKKEIVLNHNVFDKKHRCNICYPYNKSSQEEYIFNFIQKYDENTKSRFKKLISPKEIDIYSPKFNIAIEYDGIMYHSYGKNNWTVLNNYLQENKFYHLYKTEELEKQNIKLFHIFSNEWEDDIKRKIWKSIIKNHIGINKKIYARKTIIKEVEKKEAKIFLKNNHLQGYSPAKINIGLYYNEELLSLMTFSKSRFRKNIEFELIRYCNKINHSVIGGASKLFKYFVKNYKPLSIISYANRRWSNGNLYKVLGFSFLGKSNPNYFYFKNTNELFSRQKFQKHKLKQMNNYSDNKTETQIMYENNYRKIYDCGNLVYLWYNNLN